MYTSVLYLNSFCGSLIHMCSFSKCSLTPPAQVVWEVLCVQVDTGSGRRSRRREEKPLCRVQGWKQRGHDCSRT